MNVGKFNNLEEILFEYGVHPDDGGIWGKELCSKSSRFRDPNYYSRLIQQDPTAAFIYALCNTPNPEGEFLVSCNSVPPGSDFIVLSNVSSLDNWKQSYDKCKYHGQLKRAGFAASESLSKFCEVNSYYLPG